MSTRASASNAELSAVTAVLHREARLLDERRYREWLGLLTPDVRYVMASVENRYSCDGRGPEARLSLFDDGLAELDLRVRRFETETAWPEDPPTRHVHVISNVEAFRIGQGFEVLSAFVNYRSRGDHDEMYLVGRRVDLWRDDGDGLLLANRIIHSGQSVLKARNLNTFL